MRRSTRRSRPTKGARPANLGVDPRGFHAGGVRRAGAQRDGALDSRSSRKRASRSIRDGQRLPRDICVTGVPIPRPRPLRPAHLVEAGDQNVLITSGRGATIRPLPAQAPIGRHLRGHWGSPTITVAPTRRACRCMAHRLGSNHISEHARRPTAVIGRDRRTRTNREFGAGLRARHPDPRRRRKLFRSPVSRRRCHRFDWAGTVYEHGGVRVIAFGSTMASHQAVLRISL